MEILRYTPRGRAELYAMEHDLTIAEPPLGGGQDGIVLATNRKTAIKSMNYPELYRQEKAVYQHLTENHITSLSGFQIPKLVGLDDDYYIIEMTVVSPPYVLDFASARLERPAPFPDDIMEEWLQDKIEEFGDNWPRVRRLIFAFECNGVYLNDVAPRNVHCG